MTRAQYVLDGVIQFAPAILEEMSADTVVRQGVRQPSPAAKAMHEPFDAESHLTEIAKHLVKDQPILWSAPPGMALLDADTPRAVEFLRDHLEHGTPIESRKGKMHAWVRFDTEGGTRRPQQQLANAAKTKNPELHALGLDVKPGFDSYGIVAPSGRKDGGAPYEWIAKLPDDPTAVPLCPEPIKDVIEKHPGAWKTNGPKRVLEEAKPAAPAHYEDVRPRHDRLLQFATLYARILGNKEDLRAIVFDEAMRVFDGEEKRAKVDTDGIVEWCHEHVEKSLREEWDDDEGRSKLFVAHYGDRIAYVPELACFMAWSAKTGAWHRRDVEFVGQKLVELGDLVFQNAARATGERRTDLLSIYTTLCKNSKIKSTIEFMKSRFRETVDAFDSKPGLLLFPGGDGYVATVLDLDTLAVKEATPEHMITRHIADPYEPAPNRALFDKLVEHVFEGRDDERIWFQRMMGLALHGGTFEHLTPFLFGDAGTGKSTMMNLALSAWGSYGVACSAKVFFDNARDSAAPSADLTALRGARLVITDEMQSTGSLGSVYKGFAAGDTVSCRAPFAKVQMTYKPQGTVWFQGNVQPRADYQDPGIWRRMKILRVDRKLEESREAFGLGRHDLASALEVPWSRQALVQWALEGWVAYREHGLPVVESIEAEVGEFRRSQNPVLDFVEERIETGPGEMDALDVFHAFTAWSIETRTPIEKKDRTKKGFLDAMAALGMRTARTKGRDGSRSVVIKGVFKLTGPGGSKMGASVSS